MNKCEICLNKSFNKKFYCVLYCKNYDGYTENNKEFFRNNFYDNTIPDYDVINENWGNN